MARISYAGQAVTDLEHQRCLLYYGKDALPALGVIDEPIFILGRHPLIGCRVEDCLHELTFSQGKTGYIALYSFEMECDAIFPLALRH